MDHLLIWPKLKGNASRATRRQCQWLSAPCPQGNKGWPSTGVLAPRHRSPDGKGAGPISHSHPLAPSPSVLSELKVQSASEISMKPSIISAQSDSEDNA